MNETTRKKPVEIVLRGGGEEGANVIGIYYKQVYKCHSVSP
jgi:hypothetical protein